MVRSQAGHAALCPMYLGVKAVIAKSFERIHSANLINSGIIPLTFAEESDYEKLAQGDDVEIPDVSASLSEGRDIVLKNIKTGETCALKHGLTEKQVEMILAGGTLNLLAQQKV